MGVLCRSCYMNTGATPPPVRTRKAPCEVCGSQHERADGSNYDYPDKLMPTNKDNPDRRAEREHNGMA